jgi:predicted permease
MTALARLAAMFRSRRLDRDLADEIGAHLAMQEEEFRARGMSAREAHDAARREFGGVTQTVERYRERRGVAWLETAGRDFRYALRGLRQNKAFTAAAVLSLALGIGANTAIFTLVRALLLRSLPVAHPEELVTLYRTGAWGRGISSYPLYLEVAKRTDLFQGAIARTSVEKAQIAGERPETVQQELVSGNYFRVLGVGPALGRLIGDDDNRTPHAHPIAVLSYDYWQRRYGGDPGVLGRGVTVNDQPLTIVGVAARGFRGVEVDQHPDLWAPAMMRDGPIMEVGAHWLWMMARRRPDVSRRQIQAAMDVLLQQYLQNAYGANPVAAFKKIAMNQHIEVREGAIGLSGLRERFGMSLRVLMAAVGLVLLASCANVANLLLARGAARRREISLRVSLGATRERLIAQALIESVLLAGCGAVVGVALAFWGTHELLAFLPEPFAVEPDATVLAFTAALTVMAALLFGLGPAAQATRVDPADGLRFGTGASAPASGMRRTLVIAQVAFSVVLVVLAGLFGHSMAQLRSVAVGFRADAVIGFSLEFPERWTQAQRLAPRDRVVADVAAIPGVTAVSYGFPGPFLNGTSQATIRVLGVGETAQSDAAAAAANDWVNLQIVGPRFFETIGAAMREGREIEDMDTAKSRNVAVVNEAFLRRCLPGERRPLDRMLALGKKQIAIVGVARDMAHQGVRKKPAPTVYLPAVQSEGTWAPVIVVRGAASPDSLIAAIRREGAKLPPQVTVTEPRPIRRQIDESLLVDRLLSTVGGFFGIVALALAAVGLYGVVAYGTARRAREIGIRIALGARRGAVAWMVVRDALLLVVAGLAVGLPASYFAARQVASLLFELQPADKAAFAITTLALAAAGLAAALLPARRAARVEPVSVLRAE